MHKIVLVRHGQSQWNLENRFTGWVDVDLSERGIAEAREAGRTFKREGYTFDIALASYLKRAIRTLWLIEEELDQMWLPVVTDWRLNERHYGALQGLDKRETVERHGAEQVQQWRRGYAVRPPALAADDAMYPGRDPRYRQLANPPATESLADTLDRVVCWWDDTVLPLLKAGRQPLVVAHGNSLRALVKHLDGLNETEVMALNIPTGLPLVYELDDTGRALRHYYLADPEQVAAAEDKVRKQTG